MFGLVLKSLQTTIFYFWHTAVTTTPQLIYLSLLLSQMKSLVLAALVASASAFVPSRPMAARATSSLQMAESVEERVRELVKSQLNPDGDFADSASFMDDLGADSLDAVELIMSLEEEFEIEIPDDEVEGITTVQAAIDFVKSKQ
jgi:acyl carrier protein